MNIEQHKLLNKMKMLIKKGNYRFENRRDRDYKKELSIICITEYEAWFKHILYLQEYDYVPDFKPSYKKSNDLLIFKRIINNYIVYIKLKIELNQDNKDECVCLSFHRDEWR